MRIESIDRRPLSPTARANIAAALSGRPHPHRGHPISDETRAKISAALKGRARGGRRSRSSRSYRSRAGESRAHGAEPGRARRGARTRHPGVGVARRRHAVPAGLLPAAGGHGQRARQQRHHPGKTLISAHTRRSYLGFVHTKTRRKRSKIVIRKTMLVRAHRVWRKRPSRSRRARL